MNSETIVALSSIVIAVFALVISIWSGIETRQYNRLSVFPFIDVVVLTNWDEKRSGVYITNDGAGPAIIKKISLYVDGKEINGSAPMKWNAVLNLLGINENWVGMFYCNPGVAIRPEQEIWLLYVFNNKVTEEMGKRFMKSIARLQIKIFYSSIYGQSYQTIVSCKDLLPAWFKSEGI